MDRINHSLLKTVRLLRGRTQEEVTKAVGIPQGSLSKAENGLLDLPNDALHKLFDYYDLPKDFFLRAGVVSSFDRLYYRKKLSVSDKTINKFEAKIRVFRFIVDDLMTAVELPEYTLGSYNPDEISVKEIAHRVRARFKISGGAIPNLTTLLENNGVIIIRFDFETDKIDGVTITTEANRKVIIINDQMPNDRIRFSLAHELGHLVMHLDNDSVCSLEEAETQADEFASEFLMPEEEIRPMLYNVDFGSLGLLKRRWQVSMRALVRRAKDLNAITPQQYRNLQIAFSKKGYTKSEPIPLPLENPTIWEETLNLYREELGYTDDDLMSVMRIHKTDFAGWVTKNRKNSPQLIEWYRDNRERLAR